MSQPTPEEPQRLLPRVASSDARPFWSVVIPVYERTQFIEQCIKSVLDQPMEPSDIEIIVHDNFSPNDLGPLVKKIGGDRVRFERNTSWRGLYGNVNDALAKTRGRWIHVLHDDDFVMPGFYPTFQRALPDAPAEVGVACCHYTNLDERNNTPWAPPPFRSGPGVLNKFLDVLVVGNPLNVPAVVYRRDVFETVGLYREELSYTADWEFYIRAAVRFLWWYQPENLARYRIHASQTTWLLAGDGKAARDLRKTLDIVETYLPKDVRERVLPTARKVHCESFVAQAGQALKGNNPTLALALLREGMKVGSAVPQSESFFQILSSPLCATLREELVRAWRAIQTE